MQMGTHFFGKDLVAELFAGFYILLGFQVFFFLFAELPGATGSATANSAHLGGMLGAYIYERKLLALPSLISLFRRLAALANRKSGPLPRVHM